MHVKFDYVERKPIWLLEVLTSFSRKRKVLNSLQIALHKSLASVRSVYVNLSETVNMTNVTTEDDKPATLKRKDQVIADNMQVKKTNKVHEMT